MTKEIIDKINEQIKNFNKLNLEKIFANAYPKEDLANVRIGLMTVKEFISMSKRVVLQLDKEINSENGLFLPNAFESLEITRSTVYEILQALIQELKIDDFQYAENSLLWLIQYQMQNGFFDKSKVKIHSIDALELKTHTDELKIISENYKKLESNYLTLLKDLNTEKTLMNQFVTQKKGELQQISNNLATANTNNTQIQNLLNSSTKSESKIVAELKQIEKEKTKSETIVNDINKTFSEFKLRYTDLINELNTQKENFINLDVKFQKQLAFVEGKQEYFKKKNNELNDLIGREVGASLFETFKQRKEQLIEPLKWWKNAVIWTSILTSVMIFAIFTNFFGLFGGISTAFKWENIIVNVLKSSPFFFLLYYCIAQYNKERNFQEEYAFKSATALTIKAYSDILKDDKNKDELVMKAVNNIYKSPIYSKLKPTKDVNNVIDVCNELISKGSEIITKK